MLLLPFLSLLVSGIYADVTNSSDTSHSYNNIFQRNDEITRRLSQDIIQGIRKMAPDEGEKFFLSYYNFAVSTDGNSTLSDRDLDPKYEYPLLARSFPFQSALEVPGNALGLETRDFNCPTGTNACTSIGRSDRCCSTGSTCEIVTDTGSGDVGCCPSGEVCSGTVGSCASGYTTCSAALGGGCCIPGYECVSGGCAYLSVVTITVDSSVVISTETYSTIPQSTHSTQSTTSTTSTSSTSTESSKTETTDSLIPPARPTSLTSLTTTSQSTTSRVDVCPTGFYACSAVYHGGCCQTGRDCDTTSCPTTSSTTFTSDGVTIVEPVATGSSKGTGKCANGWFSCADTVGGGCCPSGYACGQSCTATAAHSTVAKEQATATSTGSRVGVNWLNWIFGIILAQTVAIMSDKPQQPLPFIYQFAAGAVAGVSEVPIGRRQDPSTGVPVAGAEHYNGMFDCFSKIVKTEGFSRLYRGISAPILMEAPKRATKFAANDSWGTFYRNAFGVDKQTQSLAILTGATAGATEAFVVVPFELVKIRLQDKASAGKYNGMLDVVKKIVKTEGPLAMYNGLESTLWRHILWNAGYFGCIFQVRAQLPAPEPGNKGQQTRNDLLAGSIGGIAGTILNTPMDVVKSRIQNTSKVSGQIPKYNWAWPAVGTVMKEEGFGALYKGFIPKVLRLGPGGGILLVVFTGVMDFFRKMREEQ
ncbi:hypothetical protein N7448_005990 [Penicillium atrosanguineum]|uniref:uncharacterized protein n=1 Tax=Penicillium atrosanguineum TaxID=1132637 RepID=UPI00239AB4C7|nr:uncharacterized protein N7443_009752 [Penicillium atrosanguineum]KAJ5131832.1 hypothetical protein N7448_005990 [Penicillium atrosanguineum]KAJ5289499.1 hypothetical protein N7443_009752 [Penicillium atrosanguineum]